MLNNMQRRTAAISFACASRALSARARFLSTRAALSAAPTSVLHAPHSLRTNGLCKGCASVRCFCAASTTPEAKNNEEQQDAPAWASNDNPPSEKVVEIADAIAGLTLVECAELSNVLKEKLGLSDVDLMAAAPAGGAAAGADADDEPAAEKTSFDIKLEGFDAKAKIKVIKEVRSLCGLGLKEAKELVEGRPRRFFEGRRQGRCRRAHKKAHRAWCTGRHGLMHSFFHVHEQQYAVYISLCTRT